MVTINTRDRKTVDKKTLIPFDGFADADVEPNPSILEPIFESAPHIAVIKDAKTLRYMKVNQACETLFNCSRREIIGRLDSDLLGEDAEAIQNNDRACLASGVVLEPIREKVRVNGHVVVLNVTRIPIFDAFGEPQFLISLAQDVTSQAIAESNIKRLRFLERASAALNDNLDIKTILNDFAHVIVEHMADWCIVDLFDEDTRAIERIAVASRDQNFPPDIKDWWKTHTLNYNADEGLGLVLRTGQSRVYRDVNVEKVRRWFPNERDVIKSVTTWGIKSSAIVPLTGHKRILGALSFVSSTENNDYDDFDYSVIQELGRRCSLAIENAKLYARANEASRTKSAFLANISHEIRTPLGAIMGFSEILKSDRSLDPESATQVDAISRNADQLMDLVSKLLDFSEVEAQAIVIKPRPFDVSELLRDAADLLRAKGRERGLEVSISGAMQKPRWIVTDPHRLRQILNQVLVNALKFTPKGTISMRVRFLDSRLEIDVEDTGIGLTLEQQRAIFQPFVQVDGTTSRSYEGTGLGLFLARKLARLLSGDVTAIRSSPGRGSLFRIAVRIQSVPDISTLGSISPLASETLKLVPGPLKRILMVDDSEDNRHLIGALLNPAQSKIHLDFAEAGEEAIKMALANAYDLILLDIQMPGMDGFETLRQLQERGIKAPIIALTAHSMRGDRERCLSAGFMDYLSKPVSRASLLNCLDRHLPGIIQ